MEQKTKLSNKNSKTKKKLKSCSNEKLLHK